MAKPRRAKVAPYPAELRDKLIAMVQQGRSAEEVATEHGGKPSAQTIRNWMATVPTPHQQSLDLRGEVLRLRKVLQAKTLEAQALRVLVELTEPELLHGVPSAASPFDDLRSPTVSSGQGARGLRRFTEPNSGS